MRKALILIVSSLFLLASNAAAQDLNADNEWLRHLKGENAKSEKAVKRVVKPAVRVSEKQQKGLRGGK